MKKKRIVSLVACGVMVAGAALGLSACKKEEKLTIWASQTQQQLVKDLMQDFLNENPDFKLKLEYGVIGEDNAFAQVSKDVEASADVFGYANDQVMNLVNAGALACLGTSMVDKLKAENEVSAVEAGKLGEGYYGYPYAADNGFFLQYDASVVSEEQAKTLDGVLEACEANNKVLLMRLEGQSSWYIGSFFYAAGGKYNIDWAGQTMAKAESNFGDYAVDINGETSTQYTIGQVGGQALVDLASHKKGFVTGDDSVIDKRLDAGNLGAVITGTWKAKKIQESFGDNYRAAVMPKYTSSLDGRDYQIKPFIGYKLYGVNRNSKHLTEAHQVAAYLTSEKAQQKRYEVLGTGPSNNAVAASDAIKNDVVLKVINAQKSFSIPQTPLPSEYFSALDAFGTDVYNGGTTSANLKDKLDKLISGIKH